ncbi:multimerin-1-like [Mercenaria mercenaria]|uniref:multimerin-1-like n=1 Tax=Mercenaria mercenaria TaxID=6596 RepID=UPI00234E75E2|nr:multimerin-1-like [Mercenaria mercenaria]
MAINENVMKENNNLQIRVKILEAYIRKIKADPDHIAETPDDDLTIPSLRNGTDGRQRLKLKSDNAEHRLKQHNIGSFSPRSFQGSQNKIVKRQTTDIAFYAYLTYSPCILENEIVIFNNEGLDYGGGYETYDGIYTVQVAGTYVFTWTMASSFKEWFITEIIVDGATRSWIVSTDGNDQATGTVVVDVYAGSHVFIRRGRGYGCTVHDTYTRSRFQDGNCFEISLK